MFFVIRAFSFIYKQVEKTIIKLIFQSRKRILRKNSRGRSTHHVSHDAPFKNKL